MDLQLTTPQPFHFREVLFAHGWLQLAPFRWDDDSGRLHRDDLLPNGAPCSWSLEATNGGLLLRAEAGEEWGPYLEARARWMLALDEDLAAFHRLCAGEPGLRRAAERGHGRLLRSPAVWEEVVKTLFSVNTTWKQTVAMTRRLVELCGTPLDEERRAFPTPQQVLQQEESTLRTVCRIGYRAGFLHRLAHCFAEETALERLKSPNLTTEEVESRLRALPGIGPYAAANVLMLLGHYDHLPVDSWFRTTVSRAWFGGRTTPDRDMVAAFDRFRPYRTLAYLCYDWQGAEPYDWTAHPGGSPS